MSKRIVLVTLAEGDVVSLRGKLADFIYWMVRNKEKVEPVRQGELMFNWTHSEEGETGNFRATIRVTLPSEKFST